MKRSIQPQSRVRKIRREALRMRLVLFDPQLKKKKKVKVAEV